MIRIVCTGGGTGGHIFPGIAVIEELRSLGVTDVIWIGARSGMDRTLLSSAGIPFIGIPSGKLRRYFSLLNFLDLFKIAAGLVSSLYHLFRLRPALVFSKGGFVSVPPCLAARILGIPLVTHECDFSPGLATRINARWAKAVFVTYPETIQWFSPRIVARSEVTGNPVRGVFYTANHERGLKFLKFTDNSLPILLVLGGSLGSRQINELIYADLEYLTRFFRIVHQCGSTDNDFDISVLPAQVQDRYRRLPFIGAEMPDVLATSDLVLARSGAGTVWECAVLGKPMVLIPLEKGASRGDQLENARWFEERGAAIVLTGSSVTTENLRTALVKVRDDTRMTHASAAIAAGRPAALAAARLVQLAGG